MDAGPSQSHGICLHYGATEEHPHGRTCGPGEYDVEYLKQLQQDARSKSKWPAERVGYPEKDTRYARNSSCSVVADVPSQASFESESSGNERIPCPGGLAQMCGANWRWVCSIIALRY